MFAWSRERVLIAGLVAVHITAMIAAAGFALGWWSSDADEEASLVPIPNGSANGPGVDGPTITPDASLSLVTATPGRLSEVTATPTAIPPTATATSAPATSTPAPTNTPVPPSAPEPPPAAPASTPADFSGRWRIVDVVTEGSNAGQTFTFDVSLSQQGDQISGGNSGIQISGVVNGDTAILEYVQPALGYTGTFTWTMVGPNQAAGTFTNSYPNAGTSNLQRLQ